MKYRPRLVENQIDLALKSGGAVWLCGPKACGKTETALRFAESAVMVDINKIVPNIMSFKPEEILNGKVPRLLSA
jgi:ABC-type lipopolysaccharide export system ATPase subunit